MYSSIYNDGIQIYLNGMLQLRTHDPLWDLMCAPDQNITIPTDLYCQSIFIATRDWKDSAVQRNILTYLHFVVHIYGNDSWCQSDTTDDILTASDYL